MTKAQDEFREGTNRMGKLMLSIPAVCFASFLVIANLKSPLGTDAYIATRYFAVGIPVTIGYSMVLLRRPKTGNLIGWVYRTVYWGLVSAGSAGIVCCMLGLYWLFRHVSHEAASLFLLATLATYFVVAAVWFAQALIINDEARRERAIDDSRGDRVLRLPGDTNE
ncbi:hypothetical protein [Paraburkholderia acidiphila]|uniref:Uncharacterized protein n=1 Tax=Paraburkholderia acidiphila TaxID=2571747 RepID=A0A7Z2J7X2_9BURK|nr:hypothetical protein [Paraburkholderia acidiphila]QGZ55042.1 hypothetical protein FAZ97_08990 [Paraburkholderia acidiphila]